MLKKFAELWKPIALLAVFAILISFILELFVPLEEWQLHWIEVIDLVAIAVLAVELAARYLLAREKKNFLKKNWVMVAALLPFGQVVRAIKAIKVFGKMLASWFSKVLHMIRYFPKAVRAYRASAVGVSKVRERVSKKRRKKRKR